MRDSLKEKFLNFEQLNRLKYIKQKNTTNVIKNENIDLSISKNKDNQMKSKISELSFKIYQNQDISDELSTLLENLRKYLLKCSFECLKEIIEYMINKKFHLIIQKILESAIELKNHSFIYELTWVYSIFLYFGSEDFYEDLKHKLLCSFEKCLNLENLNIIDNVVSIDLPLFCKYLSK